MTEVPAAPPLDNVELRMWCMAYFRFLCLLLLLAVAGCAYEPPEFRLNTEGREPGSISPAQREMIVEVLTTLYGTPDEPKVPREVDLQLPLLEMAAGPIRSDEHGHPSGLYRQHCATCHGITGDGVGPTATAQHPYPRDFRNAIYKYTSTVGGAKPLRDDLELTLHRGLPGTAMPAFERLPDEQLAALLEYVKYLSLRGETELYLLQLVVDEDEYPVEPEWIREDAALPAAASWNLAEQLAVAPSSRPPLETAEQTKDILALGRELYFSEQGRCAQCHGPEGKGDGEQTELYDDWNKPKKGATAEQTRELAERFRLPIQRVTPRDFTAGVFRGGQRSVDLYWRVHVGIKGTPMPAGGPAPGTAGALQPEEIWQVVAFVRSLADLPP